MGRYQAIAWLLGVTALWGATFPVVKGALDHFTLLCAVAFAAHVLALAKAVERQHPAAVNTVQLGVVAALSPALLLLAPPRLRLELPLLVALLVTGVLASALAFGIMARVLTVLRPSETGVILAFELVAAAAISVLFGYETLRLDAVLGGALVVAGVVLVARGEG